METTVYIKRDNQSPIPVRLRTVRNNGQWLAVAEIQTKSGPIRLTAMASEQTVTDLVKRGVAKLPTAMVAGADIFSSIAKFTQSQAAQNVLKQAQGVVKNPLFMTALSFIPGFAPAMSVMNKANEAVKAAENIMGRARQGDKKAQNSVNVINSSARKGSKKGTLLLALLQAADGVRRTFFSGDATEVNDISQFAGWSPPWNAAPATGNSWTPPWGSSNGPPQQLPPPQGSQQLPPQAPRLPGWPQMPPMPQAPYSQTWPSMPANPQPTYPGSAPYPYPWFAQTNTKCWKPS